MRYLTQMAYPIVASGQMLPTRQPGIEILLACLERP